VARVAPYAAAAIVITAAGLVLFWGLLFPRDPDVVYPCVGLQQVWDGLGNREIRLVRGAS